MSARRVLLLLPLFGCAPSLQQLVDGHSFPDAMCLTEQRNLGPEAQQRVLRAMASATAQSIQIDVLPASALGEALGPKGQEIAQKYVLVRFAYSLPSIGSTARNRRESDQDYAEWLGRGPNYSSVVVPEKEAALEIVQGRQAGRAGQALAPEPFDRSHLAALTGEKLPEPRLVKVLPSSESGFFRALRQIGGMIFMPLELVGAIAHTTTSVAIGVASLGTAKGPFLGYTPMQITEGLLRDPPSTPGYTRTEYPTEADYQRVAPMTEALYRLSSGCVRPRDWESRTQPQPFYRCEVLAFPRPADEASPELGARLRFAYGLPYNRDARCVLRTEIPIPLPPGPTLEARLGAALGGGKRALIDWLPK